MRTLWYDVQLRFRNKVILFWMFLFPIILCTLFSLVLRDVYALEEQTVIPLGIEMNEAYEQDVTLQAVLQQLSEGEDALFSLEAAEGDVQEQLEQGRWQEIAAARSADVFLEIFPRGVDKGTALQAVCDALAIPAEKAIAFGDHEMDIPMLKKAGLGIAMGNAVDSLKEAADVVTRTNDEAGVAWALNRILDGEY